MKESINIDRVPYGLAVHDSEEEEAVLEVIKNHKTIMGDNVKLFEKKVSDLFGKERVEHELFEFLTHDFKPRFGGGIGMTRLIAGMKKAGLM